MQITRTLSIALLALLLAQPAIAARGGRGGGGGGSGPSTTDIAVGIQGPQQSLVYTDSNHTVTVSNISRKTAENVRVTITFTETDTSPQQFILGTVSNIDARCSHTGNALECAVGTMRKGASETIQFTYNAPVSTKPLTIGVEAVTDTTDTNLQNNVDVFTVNPTYTPTPVTSGTATNHHCTGQNLTSFFECTLFPSSITSHTATFYANKTLSANTLTGTWDILDNDTRLLFTYTSGSSAVLSFDGRSAGGNCFEGITQFTGSSAYVSPYRVCF